MDFREKIFLMYLCVIPGVDTGFFELEGHYDRESVHIVHKKFKP